MKCQSYNLTPVYMEPLQIPSGKRVAGLTVYCNKCKTNVDKICKETSKVVTQCKFGDRHTFKVYAHVPGTKNERRTKTLVTRDVDKAVVEALAFIKSVKGRDENSLVVKPTKREKTVQENTPQLLLHSLSRYVGWLQNENVPSHLKRERSADYIEDIKRALKTLVIALKESGYDVNTLCVSDLDDALVGIVFDYLLDKKKFSGRSFNKYMGAYTSFVSWYNKEYDASIKNVFEVVPRKKIQHHPETISKDEFEKLLNAITPEKGIHFYDNGTKKHRNYYRPYLKAAFRLALYTGRRREEVITLKFNDIITDADGNSVIKSEDYKTNRIQNRTENSKKFNYIPVTNELRELLLDLGWNNHKGSNAYILAPDVETKRNKVLSDVLSRGFTHFYSQLETGRELTFKCLRKTFITNISIYMGGNAKAITGHSDDAVIENHYLNKESVAKAAKGFSVFEGSLTRQKELKQVRNQSKIKSVSNEKQNAKNGLEIA